MTAVLAERNALATAATRSQFTSVLVVDDDPVTRATLKAFLTGAGYSVTLATDGGQAWERMQETRFPIVISDWYMPEVDGVELCRRIRRRSHEPYVYFVLITAHGGKQQYLAGMEAGADDFIMKPVDPDELRARIKVAERMLGVRQQLRCLEGLLPVCAYCKSIRDDEGYWNSLEAYIEKRSDAQFSHSICPSCYVRIVEPQLDRAGESDDAID
ncbi:MAG: response regulator [Gemmatimonadota bacterium]